jgi:hypothetical protein
MSSSGTEGGSDPVTYGDQDRTDRPIEKIAVMNY